MIADSPMKKKKVPLGIGWALAAACLLLAHAAALAPAHGHAHHHHNPTPQHHHHGDEHRCEHDDPATQRALHGIHRTPGRYRADGTRLPDEDGAEDAAYRVVPLREVRPMRGAAGAAELLTTVVAPQPYGGKGSSGRGFGPAAVGPLRIVWRTLDLFDTTKYCTAAAGTVPDFKGSTIACTAATVFTTALRDNLINEVLPETAVMLAQMLQVTQVSGGLRVPSADVCGSQYTVPAADTSSSGVAGADLVMYVTAAPTSGAVAWAGFCTLDSNGRPVVGRVNFSPEHLGLATQAERRKTVRVGLHEMLHVLGFAYVYITGIDFKPWAGKYNFLQPAVTTGTTRRGGQPVTLYKAPKALAAARTYFNCPALDGVELENEGGSGTAQSHWERRTHVNDLMAGISSSVMAISSQTLALLEDSGHYTANMSMAEDPGYLNRFGCGVFNSACNTEAGGAGSYFCFDTTNTKMCTYDRKAIGTCRTATYSGDLPSWGQYFSGQPRRGGSEQLFDYCPVAMASRICEDNSLSTGNPVQAFFYGPRSRCFETTSTLIQAPAFFSSTNPGPARCLEARCVLGTRVQFRVGSVVEWIDCPANGASAVINVTALGYTGAVTCPIAADFCTEDLYYEPVADRTTATTSSPSPASAPASAASSAAAVPTTTTTTPTTVSSTAATTVFTSRAASTTTPTTVERSTTTTTTTTAAVNLPTVEMVIALAPGWSAEQMLQAIRSRFSIPNNGNSNNGGGGGGATTTPVGPVYVLRNANGEDRAALDATKSATTTSTTTTAAAATVMVVVVFEGSSATAAEAARAIASMTSDADLAALGIGSAASLSQPGTSDPSTADSDQTGIIVGASVGGAAVLLLVVVAVVVVSKRRQVVESVVALLHSKRMMDINLEEDEERDDGRDPIHIYEL